jgi:aminopeptidase N
MSTTAAAAATTTVRGGSSTTELQATTTSTITEDVDVLPKAAPVEIFRKDYQPLPIMVKTIDLDFQLFDDGQPTIVTTTITLHRNPMLASTDDENVYMDDVILDGDETSVSLRTVQINGIDAVEGKDYLLSPGQMTLKLIPANSVITIIGTIQPELNTQLSGLYKSDDMYCTQCEAMGFRRITYYLDRPDNMAIFNKVRIEANREQFPLLLSNGNLVEEGMINDSDRHYAIWSDPFPKPSYLFALVAGKLGSIHDTFTTMSGREVQLHLYSEERNVHKLHYAMDALKRSMKWDEERFGLEYDLDLFNIVAVDNFNMGAMENKSLNVFNTAYVLADTQTATDTDFERVEAVIGHEYFHNWTGNRVTCRDWFQLTLKEGLTVFRDQEFSADMNSKAVKRVEDVRALRARQFNEDAGPMSHPIRPESYISMDNFYTGTVYIKGAEVIRMYQTILSQDGFRKGMDLYFQRHDGTAVTCDDFLAAMADANQVDLSQFARWYSTPGTPTITYATEYKDGTFTLTLSQMSNSKEGPLHIPVAIGLLDKATGKEVVPTTVLDLKEDKQSFTFDGLDGDVVLSLLRDFSAPVKVVSESGVVDEEAMAFLAARDTDDFNRWESGQNLYTSLIFQTMKDGVSETTLNYVNDAFERALTNESSDFSIQAYNLILPTESTLAEDMEIVDPIGIHKARGSVKQALARKFQKEIRAKYDNLTELMESEGNDLKIDATAVGRRRLRNVLLEYLCSIKETDEEQIAAAELAMNHFQKAKGMTDKVAGLAALSSMDGKGAPARDEAMQQFYDDAKGDSLVLNKWFSIQAMANLPDVLDRVKALKASHPDFTLRNPNRCRSLIGAYATNSAAFHDEAGESYKFMGEVLAELDQLNPQISSRLAGNLINWRRYDAKRGQMMKAELEKLAATKLSDDLYEIVTRGLKE